MAITPLPSLPVLPMMAVMMMVMVAMAMMMVMSHPPAAETAVEHTHQNEQTKNPHKRIAAEAVAVSADWHYGLNTIVIHVKTPLYLFSAMRTCRIFTVLMRLLYRHH